MHTVQIVPIICQDNFSYKSMPCLTCRFMYLGEEHNEGEEGGDGVEGVECVQGVKGIKDVQGFDVVNGVEGEEPLSTII